MYKLLACIKKEALLLRRDRVGLSILFIMPMALIFVMTLIQDSAFRSLNEKGVPVIFVNNDEDTLGFMVERGLKGNDLCAFYDSINGKPATMESARNAVAKGQFMLGIVIPKNASATIRKNVSDLVSETLYADSGKISLAISDSVAIQIFIDPVAKKSFVLSITSNLREFISEIKNQIMFQTFSKEIAEIMPDQQAGPANAYERSQIIRYHEDYASDTIGGVVPNSVQHNVPAWAIFAMFFIVIPLSGSIMKEKSEGSIFRLHTMPSSYMLLLMGKIVVYVLVCLFQFLLMLSVGLYILPMLGLPVLQLGNSFLAIFILTVCTALAATGFSVMVGTLAGTEQQAAIMGSLSILLLSALGGVWVPTYIMPAIMRQISVLSPLNWALEGFYQLFLRGSDTLAILPHSLKLILFFATTMLIANFANRLKRKI